MTVSRVVRGLQNVRAQTVARVEQAIQELGYRPDPTMSALASYRMQGRNTKGEVNLAFLDRDQTAYSGLVYDGLRQEAQLHGYSVERFVLQESRKSQLQLNRMLIGRGVRGLLFGPSNAEWSFDEWDWDEFAMVSLGALSHRPTMHSVCMHYFEGAYSASRMAMAQGCERIGFVVDPRLENRTAHQWLGGYVAALDAEDVFIYRGDVFHEGAIADWLRRHRIEALLTVHGELADCWTGSSETFYLLNDIRLNAGRGIHRYSLDPKQIGVEGIRFVHHLLLRREFGLPSQAKITVLKGTWTQ